MNEEQLADVKPQISLEEEEGEEEEDDDKEEEEEDDDDDVNILFMRRPTNFTFCVEKGHKRSPVPRRDCYASHKFINEFYVV